MSDGSEFICEPCKGTGCHGALTKDVKDPRFLHCPKCYGTGKLDWIENIVGKKADIINLSSNWGMSSTSISKSLRDVNLENEMADLLAKEMANQLDQDIIKYLGIPDKLLKPPGKPETIVIDIIKRKIGGNI